jgi:hypothetical protein
MRRVEIGDWRLEIGDVFEGATLAGLGGDRRGRGVTPDGVVRFPGREEGCP